MTCSSAELISEERNSLRRKRIALGIRHLIGEAIGRAAVFVRVVTAEELAVTQDPGLLGGHKIPETMIHHSLYSVPSSPVPCALVNTSNTFCPPQESDVGSSCME